MAHNHFCAVCFIPVAHCSDESCYSDEAHPNAGEHYCSAHHPDPQYQAKPTPVASRINPEQIADAVVRKMNEGKLDLEDPEVREKIQQVFGDKDVASGK